MTLAPGGMLSHYRLVEKIGEGGMGVVWKALDTTLEREVAIKVLPDSFAADAERLARFEREAKLLASLNHPGIATIHGLHDSEGVRFLAMELAPGIDLAQRLADGPLPVDEALDIASQVATALEAAHENGVIHRDLKPANIQVGPDGKVKVLDFGLAKAFEPDMTSGSASLSPTLTTPATRAGVILGTAAYMSPEQAKGKAVDRRADIWAFGCVLYEMLAGLRPFVGEGLSEVMAAVIMAPVDLKKIPATVPAGIRRLVRRCLEKDPRRRLRDIGEARFTLEEMLSGAAADGSETGAGETAPAAGRPGPAWWMAAAGMVLAALAGAGITALLRPSPAPASLRRFELPSTGPYRSGQQGNLVSISPDGSRVAYMHEGGLWIRPLDRIEGRTVTTSGDPAFLFWSPDSAWLAFAAGGKLWKVPADGGESTVLSHQPGNLTGGSGASWGPDGRIVLARGDFGLYELPAIGGDLRTILEPEDEARGDFHQPAHLPDGSGVLFVFHPSGGRPDTLSLLADGKRTDLFRNEGQDIWHPAYSSSGHIIFRRQPANPGIWALPFSLSQHRVTGEPFLVAPDGDVPTVSSEGTLVHVRGSSARVTQLILVDRSGKLLKPVGQPQEQWPFPDLSPDGNRIAISATENEIRDLWIHDIDRGTKTRLTFGQGFAQHPMWAPQGDRVVFARGTNPPMTMVTRAADGTGEERELGEGYDPSFSPDGRHVVYARQDPDSDWDLFMLDLEGDGEPTHWLTEAGVQHWPQVSPDGRYLAYISEETGRAEIYLKRFPGGEGKWQVSVDGGHWPRWSRRGDRLYYVDGEALIEVEVTTAPALRLGQPRELFSREPLGWPLIFAWPPGFDVSPDDQQFIIARAVNRNDSRNGIVVVENWLEEFKPRP